MTGSPDPRPLAGQSFPLTGPAPALGHARLLLKSLGATVDARPVAAGSAIADWARSGAMALTGPAGGPPASVALDFSAPDGLAALRRLLARADVVLEGSRPRAPRQLGLDAEEYVAAGAVWASLTGYGRTGEDALRAGYGDDVAAAAGLVAYCDGVPYPVSDAIADPLAGAYAAAAVAAALLSPRGQLLDISLYDVAVAAGRAPSRTGPAEVVATGPGTWAVRTGEGLVRVCPPRARPPRSAAAGLGQHTREVLAGR